MWASSAADTEACGLMDSDFIEVLPFRCSVSVGKIISTNFTWTEQTLKILIKFDIS